MSPDNKPLILLTNDDGIGSPGINAAAAALARLGQVLIAAPRNQQSGAGRSMPSTSDGIINTEQHSINGDVWDVYAIGGTPAQSVQHAILELTPRKPDLVVSGINYGENLGTGVTISGTIGAALEAASFGIPALAVSQEARAELQLSHSDEIDFSAAAHFTAKFAARLLRLNLPPDVDVLKIDVPLGATSETPWKLTRLSRQWYYTPTKPTRTALDQRGPMGFAVDIDFDALEPDSDIDVLVNDKQVSVSPLSLDLTSRVSLADLDEQLRSI